MKISLYVLGVIICSVLFEKLLGNIGLITDNLNKFFNFAKGVFSPFIFGMAIAYIVNPFARFLENKLFKNVKSQKKSFALIRIVCILIAYIVFFGLVVAVISYIIPEIIVSLRNLISSIIKIAPDLQAKLQSFLETQAIVPSSEISSAIQAIFEPLQSLSSISNILTTVINSTVSFASGLLDLLLGIMIAFYILQNKEGFAQYLTKITYLMFKPERAESFISGVKNANKVFENFFIGKAIDSMIIGILCFLILNFIGMPYALLSSVIVGITNMIPYFGPFIGAVPVILMALINEPIQAVWVGIAIFALQQFDGIFLGPKILGESTGLSPIWVIFAILVGGALFGPLGMILGVPCVAVIKSLLDSFINRKYAEKYPLPDEELQ